MWWMRSRGQWAVHVIYSYLSNRQWQTKIDFEHHKAWCRKSLLFNRLARMENYTFAVDNSAISAERAESNISTNTKDQSIFTTFKALDAIAHLEPNDFAFVKRSTGTWQLAIVMETSDTYVYSDKYIKFLLDGRGHTKTIPAQQWVDMIRLEMAFSKKIEPTETCRSPYQGTSVASDTNKQLTKGTLGSRTSPGITRASSYSMGCNPNIHIYCSSGWTTRRKHD